MEKIPIPIETINWIRRNLFFAQGLRCMPVIGIIPPQVLIAANEPIWRN